MYLLLMHKNDHKYSEIVNKNIIDMTYRLKLRSLYYILSYFL